MQDGDLGTQSTGNRSLWRRLSTHFHMRPPDDDEPQTWWIASTAIPLIAAATGPLANVMSIVALVMPWRDTIIFDKPGPQDGTYLQVGIHDPKWCTALNATSLVCGVVGNIFLLFNFTQLVRYIVALPASIILWFLATGILVGITASTHIYNPPIPPTETYSQAYWSAVIAAALYFILAIILMINMLGYFLGHYPQHFALTDDQRTLILQTTMFVVWLTIGAAIFSRAMNLSFADGLYFSDITVLTLGFGDIVATNNVSRGLILPYAVIGVIILGLVVSSIHRFAKELHYDNVIMGHIERKRQMAFDRSVTVGEDFEMEIKSQVKPPIPLRARQGSDSIYRPRPKHRKHPIRATIHSLSQARAKRPKLLIMREEKDRFDAMRAIQCETIRFRRWNDLFVSLFAFGVVWTGGAAVFWHLEGITYFEALYFGFCSLITIGYGDITPTTNAGKPFFIVWSTIAVPTMTMLISEMSDTVVVGFKQATDLFADWFVLPQRGKYRDFISRFPGIFNAMQRHEEKKRVEQGFQVGVDDTDDAENGVNRPARQAADRPVHTLEELARDLAPSDLELAQQLAFAIRQTTLDALLDEPKQYSYEEWVHFTRLIQFTNPKPAGGLESGSYADEDEYGVLNWDWIGENSPMVAGRTEPEWVLARLCESLVRYMATQENNRAKDLGVDYEKPTLEKEADLGVLDEAEAGAEAA
ncbi:hypothetical protein ASPZODRAFT_781006 [Penicilliopsis zonata CBS 506.65]|uniref:Potassium channel domain-containing protein n=1 Tax=Penicilliopsis zonata CBS 506.65 TaxID=1073090 RepID=A0A1L9SB83_9EURO|nr:hypothetical protein ASPZODRAFT_781006 [Penicilliopsis zonata CBS 506.65]OJJ44369.1 hypothetical protein ASPZODRAFT_781006 [Penicilliopsis zonata CBS 506.65]